MYGCSHETVSKRRAQQAARVGASGAETTTVRKRRKHGGFTGMHR